jgi:hypothetical protein
VPVQATTGLEIDDTQPNLDDRAAQRRPMLAPSAGSVLLLDANAQVK